MQRFVERDQNKQAKTRRCTRGRERRRLQWVNPKATDAVKRRASKWAGGPRIDVEILLRSKLLTQCRETDESTA